MRGELNAGRFPVLMKRADSIDVSHLYVRGWAAFFPYQEIGDECKSSASTRMLGGDRDRVKLGTCFEFWHSSFKQTSPLPATHFSPCATPSIVLAQDLTQSWRGKHSGELVQPKNSPTGNKKKPVV